MGGNIILIATKKALLIFTLITLSLALWSCDSHIPTSVISNVGEHMDDFLQKHYLFSYVVKFEYEELSDDNIIEQRLLKCGFEIKEKQIEGDSVTYSLERYYEAEDKLFSLMCTQEDIEFVNRSGEVVITRSDIIDIKYHLGIIYITTRDDVYEKFSTVLVSDSLRFSFNNEVALVMHTFNKDDGNNNINLFMHDLDRVTVSETDEIFLKGMLYWLSEPINASVSAQIIQSSSVFKE